MEQEKLTRKRATPSLYSKVATTRQYVMKGEDQKSRLLARKARVEKQLEDAMANAPKGTEEEAVQWEMESDLARRTRQKTQEEQKKQKEKAKTFSKTLNKGTWKPKSSISLIDLKKRKKSKKVVHRSDTESR